ncbi:MAG: AraC family transcriptional regulator ligand-binding domain-containing protein [Pseudomonadota bacterium]
MPQLVRADAFHGLIDLVHALGGQGTALLRAAGLKEGDIAMSGHYVVRPSFSLALEWAAETLSCPDFGCRLADLQSMHIMGPIALAIEAADTLEDVLLVAESSMHAHDQALTLAHHGLRNRSDCLLSVNLHVNGLAAAPQNEELCICLAFQILKQISGGAWQAAEIWLRHGPMGEPARYRARFGCSVIFGQPAAGLVMASDMLGLRLPGANQTRTTLIHDFLVGRFGAGKVSMSSQVDALISPLLATNRCTHEHIASCLAMHPRTLTRRLRQEGTTFLILKDAQRRSAAAHLLTKGLSSARAAALLGYSHDSAFTVAFRRWYGMGTQAYRRARKIDEYESAHGVK